MSKMYWCLFLVSCITVWLVGCNEIPQEYESFFQLSVEEREKAIFDYSLDQQIDLMLMDRMKTHPPLNLYYQVAKNGEKIVPQLIQRIATTEEIENLRTLVLSLHEINELYFKWTTHQKYIESFEKAVKEKSNLEQQRELTTILETGTPYPLFKGLKHKENVDK